MLLRYLKSYIYNSVAELRLIINALRFKPHLSHMNLEETLAVVAQAKPRRALLIHESDGIGLHEATSWLLPQGVELAYDKEIIRVP